MIAYGALVAVAYCERCNREYRYIKTIKETIQNRDGERKVRDSLFDQPGLCPCPGCGGFTAPMLDARVARRKKEAYNWAVACVGIALVVLLLLAVRTLFLENGIDVTKLKWFRMGPTTSAWVAGGAASCGAIVALLAGPWSRRGDPAEKPLEDRLRIANDHSATRSDEDAEAFLESYAGKRRDLEAEVLDDLRSKYGAAWIGWAGISLLVAGFTGFVAYLEISGQRGGAIGWWIFAGLLGLSSVTAYTSYDVARKVRRGPSALMKEAVCVCPTTDRLETKPWTRTLLVDASDD